MTRRAARAVPGFRLTLGMTLVWLIAIVMIPLTALATRPWSLGLAGIVQSLADPRVLASLRLSFSTALGAALIDVPLGLLLAWVLVRYRFPGRRILDGLIDLPFALPTAVGGIVFAALYAGNGWLGHPLAALGITIAYTPTGILIALAFVGLPFVVRTAEALLRDLPAEVEEVAATLGARPGQIMLRVVLPALLPALATGFGLAFARAVGEYGSVIFIAGNMPMRTEIAPLMIVIRLQQFDYAGAAALGLAMLLVSLACLAAVALLRRRLEV